MESAKLHLLRFDHEISALVQQKSSLQAQLEKLSLLRAKNADSIEKMRTEIGAIEKEMKELMKRNEWIEDNQK